MDGAKRKSLDEEIRGEVNEPQEHFERRSGRRINTLLNFLTFVGLPATLMRLWDFREDFDGKRR